MLLMLAFTLRGCCFPAVALVVILAPSYATAVIVAFALGFRWLCSAGAHEAHVLPLACLHVSLCPPALACILSSHPWACEVAPDRRQVYTLDSGSLNLASFSRVGFMLQRRLLTLIGLYRCRHAAAPTQTCALASSSIYN